jgi:hypothetical protein
MATVSTISNLGARTILQVRQGADFGPYPVAIENPDGTPINPAGSTFRGQIRRKALDAAVAADFVITPGSAAGPACYFGLSNVQTAALTAGETLTDPDSQYVFDFEWVDSAGRVQCVFEGVVQVYREVTRG